MIDKENTQFVYTFSSVRNFPLQLVRSIRTLKNYVEPEQITVFYTPPYDERDQEVIEELGVNLVKEENETEAFSTFPHKEAMGFGEKIKLCQVEAENVVFLDCDTLFMENPWQILEGDFEFKARPDICGVHEEKWPELFEKYDREYMDWVPNGGFFVFKNGIHKEIAEDWAYFMEEDLNYYHGGNHQEVFALSLAVSDYDLEKMTKREHFMEFADPLMNDAIVHHMVTPNKTFNQIMMAFFRNIPYGNKIRKMWWRISD